MFPEEEFLPRVPDPEDVIIEAPPEDQGAPVVDPIADPIVDPIFDPENSERLAPE